MSYHNVVSFRVGNELHADLLALVAMTVFLAIAMDGLLLAHPDPQLRPKLIKLWQERMAEERPNAR